MHLTRQGKEHFLGSSIQYFLDFLIFGFQGKIDVTAVARPLQKDSAVWALCWPLKLSWLVSLQPHVPDGLGWWYGIFYINPFDAL